MANVHAKRVDEQKKARAKRESDCLAHEIICHDDRYTPGFAGPRSRFTKCVPKLRQADKYYNRNSFLPINSESEK